MITWTDFFIVYFLIAIVYFPLAYLYYKSKTKGINQSQKDESVIGDINNLEEDINVVNITDDLIKSEEISFGDLEDLAKEATPQSETKVPIAEESSNDETVEPILNEEQEVLKVDDGVTLPIIEENDEENLDLQIDQQQVGLTSAYHEEEYLENISESDLPIFETEENNTPEEQEVIVDPILLQEFGNLGMNTSEYVAQIKQESKEGKSIDDFLADLDADNYSDYDTIIKEIK